MLTATPGNGGPALDAGISPRAVAIDAAGNIFISDYLTQTVREVNTKGIITTFDHERTRRLRFFRETADPLPAPCSAVFTAWLWTAPRMSISRTSGIIACAR